jgi:hypothetical protein
MFYRHISLIDQDTGKCGDTIEMANEMPITKPRLLKTHLSCEMMPTQFWEKKSKVSPNN